jgi:hypothetical protein
LSSSLSDFVGKWLERELLHGSWTALEPTATLWNRGRLVRLCHHDLTQTQSPFGAPASHPCSPQDRGCRTAEKAHDPRQVAVATESPCLCVLGEVIRTAARS